MSVATLATDMTERIGSVRLVELTNFDSETATTANSTRLNDAVTDTLGQIHQDAGLIEPSDTSTSEYTTFRKLVVLGVEYHLLWYRSRTSAETKDAADAFMQACENARKRTWVAPITDAVVDVTGEDDTPRRARFAPSHFSDYRIGSRSSDCEGDEYS